MPILRTPATPQANLLISGIDGLSPDFGVMVEPGSGYCGGETFFGDDRDNYVQNSATVRN